MHSNTFFLALALSATGTGAVAAPKRSEKFAEVQTNEVYAGARLKVIRQGGQIDREWGISGVHKKLTYAQYPEVLCGKRYQAVCRGRFKKGDFAILLSINQFKKSLPTENINNDYAQSGGQPAYLHAAFG